MTNLVSDNSNSISLHIDRAEVLRYLRLPTHLSEHDLPTDIIEQLDRAEQYVLQAASPRFIHREFAVTHTEDGVRLNGTALTLTGRDIADLLGNSSSCILLAATLGKECDELIRRTEAHDMSMAVMLDAMASAAVENLCDQVQRTLAENFAESALFLTRRYSPGYGDLPLSLQKPLCAVLDTTRRIGLTVSGSGILLPRKSVTAVIGLTDTPPSEHSTHDCANCTMSSHCPYKK